MSVTLVTIEVRNGDIAKALKLFKKKVEDSGHLQELRERKEYKKPSVVKREKMNKVLYRLQRERTLEQDRENGITHRKKTK
jgi:small subunit ribosomal protein S21